MLSAELHGKISRANPPEVTMEDVLTSYVLSLFRYLNDLRIPAAFLKRAKNLKGQPPAIDELRDAQIAFWPRFRLPRGPRREPDALLILNEKDGTSTAVVVEAKYRSGLSSLSIGAADGGEGRDDKAEKEHVYPCHQLAHEYCSVRCACYEIEESLQTAMRQSQNRLTIYITSNYVPPFADLRDAVEAIRSCSCPRKNATCSDEAEQHIYWVNWQALYQILEDEASHGYPNCSRSDRNLLDDLSEVLEMRGLQPFQPFRNLMDVEEYEPFYIGDRVSPRTTPLLWQRLECLGTHTPLFGHMQKNPRYGDTLCPVEVQKNLLTAAYEA